MRLQKCFAKRVLKRFFIILIFSFPLFGNAQEIFVRKFEPGYNIEKQKTTAAFEKSDGFLLIGTKGSLYSFDGISYSKLAFPDSLSQIEVTAINENTTAVFIGLSNGMVLKYDATNLSLDPKLILKSTASITDIESYDASETWFSTYGDGIFIVDKTLSINHLTHDTHLPDDFVYAIQKDSSNNIWAGTDAGLVRMEYVANQIETRVFDESNNLPDLIVTSLALDCENQLWVGLQEGGFCMLDVVTEKIKTVDQGLEWKAGSISSLLCLDEYLWIGTSQNGLFAYQKSTGNIFSWPTQTSLPQRITQLLKSGLHGLWIINTDQLIWSAGKQIEQLIKFEQQSANEPLALLIDQNGLLWFSTENGLFTKTIDNNNYQLPKKIILNPNGNEAFIACMFEDEAGLIWLGTFDQGLLVLNPKSGKITQYNESNGLTNNNILSISGSESEVWLATLGGASKAIKNKDGKLKFQNYNAQNGPGTNYIYQVFTDSKKRTWFATDGKGILIYENGAFSKPIHQKIQNKVFYSITEAADGSMWFASSDEGLFRLKDDSLTQFGLESGLTSLAISSIIRIDSPYLLAISNNGFDFINAEYGQIIQLSNRYNIHSDKASLNAFAKDAKGSIYFGNNTGILKLENINSLAERKPLIRLRKMLVNLNIAEFKQNMILAHNESQISLEYSGIWYPNPEEIRFNINLSGRENTVYETRDHMLNFGKLSPGKYLFIISEVTNSKLKSNAIELNLSIKKPFWATWWFIVLVLIVSAFSIYMWIRKREQKLKKQQLILKERLEFEYANLRNQVNPHFLFNSFSTLIAIIETDGIEAVGYVEKLSDYFRQILHYRDTTLITIVEELQLLETYIFLQKKRYGNGLEVSICVEKNLRHYQIPPMTLQMLTENALKHNIASKSKPLTIKIECNMQFIKVINNMQAKASAEVSTGLGLENISERYRLFAGKKIEVIKTKEQFTVLLPLI